MNQTPQEKEMGISYSDNPEACFEQAIKAGRLSTNTEAPNFAGNYMYMYTTTATDKDMFKNIITRSYDV